MPNSIADGQFITLAEAAKLVPGQPHVNTLRRWCNRGFHGVVLASWRCGRRQVTSIQAIDQFIRSTTGMQAPVSRGTSARHELAEAELNRRGID